MFNKKEISKIFHERFSELANEKGLAEMTKEEKATATGLSASGIKKIEDGESKLPSVETLLKLSDYFGVSVSYLIGESDYKTPQVHAYTDVFNRFGFTEEMVETLEDISTKPPQEKYIYGQALKWLLGNNEDNSTDYPLLYSIGAYLNRLPNTNKRVSVLAHDIENLKYAITLDNLKLEDLIATVDVLLQSETDYSDSEMDAYLLDNVMQELKAVRKDFVTATTTYFCETKKKVHTAAKMKETLENCAETAGDKQMDILFYEER